MAGKNKGKNQRRRRRRRANRTYKDRLFIRIFEHKEDLLSLYNAVNGSDYQNPDELEITTLDNAAPKNKYWKFQLPSSDMFAAALFHQGLSCQKSYPHSLDARGPRSKIVDI